MKTSAVRSTHKLWTSWYELSTLHC